MAKRQKRAKTQPKKRAKLGKKSVAGRGKARKALKSARSRTKRTIARPDPNTRIPRKVRGEKDNRCIRQALGLKQSLST